MLAMALNPRADSFILLISIVPLTSLALRQDQIDFILTSIYPFLFSYLLSCALFPIDILSLIGFYVSLQHSRMEDIGV